MAAVAASQFLTTIATAMAASVTAAASTPSSLTPAASQVPTNRADDEEPQQTQQPATDACDAQLKIDEDKLAHCTDLPTDIDADKTTKKVKS